MNDQDLIGNKEKAILHIAKKQLGLKEEHYRTLLSGLGVSSSKELNYQQYGRLLGILKWFGFTIKSKESEEFGETIKGAAPDFSFAVKSKEPERKALNWTPPLMKKQMIDVIVGMLAELDLPWTYADGMAKKMFGIESLRWCKGNQTYKILQALVIYQNRKKGKGAKKDEPTIPRGKSSSGSP